MSILNVEFKASTNNLSALETLLQQNNPLFIGEDHQVDTYFNVQSGRLKLREGNIENALIHYKRENVSGAKSSHVLLYQHQPDKALKEIPVASQLKTFNNGEELMEYLVENSGQLPDVLFLDLSMPRKTGFECLAEIKENEKLKALTVIMFTTSFTRGLDLEENLKATLNAMGASDYIRKPSDFNELKQIIEKTLDELIAKRANR